MKIWLRLHGFEPCSWTAVYEYLGAAFKEIGVELCDMVAPDEPEDYIELWWGDPQFWRWSDLPVKARVSLALSEARSILFKGRDAVISNLQRSDLIICPSESATIAFAEAPIDTPIRVSPFGVDPREFPYMKRDWDGRLQFLHAGVTQFRKGSWMVPEAFVAAFKPTDNVQLVMAAPRSSPMFTRLKGEYSKQPNVYFYNGREDSLAPLYEKSHIYVSPHLSEGFGLMPLEAMATGMPCIMARCSSPREYFSKENGWWIEMSDEYAPVTACLPDTGGFWRLPDIKSLIANMRRAYMSRQECEKRGKDASEFTHNCMTWKLTAMSIVEHIKEMLSEKNISSNVSSKRGKVVTGPSGKYIATC
jgi:glycosyltransferase involved in cell wall biosynthesis